MTPERWARIKNIFEAIVELPELDQEARVTEACGDDLDAAAEIRRLLAADRASSGFMEKPLVSLHSFLPANSPAEDPSLRIGDMIARRFRILRFLNRGGMGEVYEAWDAELEEPVALKTIRPGIASDAASIERFKQEVKHAREVSHPNICRVHELFSEELTPGRKVWFLSMELLDGPTLISRLRTEGPIAPEIARPIARQLVSGLAAAHARGLVHRDFKSANIILVPAPAGQTRAVITDFGLSLKLLGPAPARHQRGGMGTPGYMAPEQEDGGEVGPLADQYALGVVFCEMLTGTLPTWPPSHDGASPAQAELPPSGIPGRWRRVIGCCLQRDPLRRFKGVGDVMHTLDAPGLLARSWKAAVLLLLLVGVTGGTVLWQHRQHLCRICNVVQLTPDTDESESPSISRDGHIVAYSSDRADTGNLDIFSQRLPDGAPIRLTRNPARDGDPSVTAEGGTIFFRSEREGGGIYEVSVPSEEKLLVSRGRNPQVSPDGRSLLYWTGDTNAGVASGKVFLLPLGGGPAVRLASTYQDARYPAWSPNGKAVIFSGCERGAKILPTCSEWWITSVDGSRVVNTHVLENLRLSNIVLSRPNPGFWYPDGLLFSGGRQGTHFNLWSIPVDPDTWQTSGDPTELLDDSGRDLSPSLSASRSIAYTRISGALHIWRIEDAVPSASAHLSKVTADAEIDGFPYISEGGRWLVFRRGRRSHRGIWLHNTATGEETQVIASGRPTQSPIISPSGDLLLYEQIDEDGPAIYARFGSGIATRLCTGCTVPSGFFDADRAFFYRDGLPSIIKVMDPRTHASRVVVEEAGASLGDATWSPANQHLLFTESQGGLKRMFAARLPSSSGLVTGPWIPIPDAGVSSDHPRWSGDGRTIFYISNTDGFICIYGWAFSPEKEQVIGRPFAIAHFHHQRASIENVIPESFNLSVDGSSLYFDLGEQSSTIWTGSLKK